jgi:hypothetical protein
MKFVFLSLLIHLSMLASSQYDSTLVQAKLFLPAHVIKGLSPTQSLTIHFIKEDASGNMQTGKFNAKKGKDNQYSLFLNHTMYFRLVFVAGGYSAQLFCVDNRKGNVLEEYDFNILLEKKLFDPKDLQFMAPCVQREED